MIVQEYFLLTAEYVTSCVGCGTVLHRITEEELTRSPRACAEQATLIPILLATHKCAATP